MTSPQSGTMATAPLDAVSTLSQPEANRLNLSHMVALVATSLLILLPIGYMVAKKSQPTPAPVGPVDSNLISSATRNEVKPHSADQSAAGAATLRAGLEKFNDGHFDQALKIFSTAAYSKQPGNVEAALWQALTLNELFRYNDAKKLLQQFMKHSDDQGINAARALNGLGFACSNTGQFDEAQGYFDRARVITDKLKGPDRVVHAQNLRGMAELALSQRAYKNALLKLQAALQIDQQYGAPVLEIAYVENDLGQTYEYMKQFDDARKCYDTALTMRQNKMKGNNPLIAYSLICIASVDYQQKKMADAEAKLKQALSITKQTLSDETLTEVQKSKLNLDIVRIYSSLGAINEYQKHYPVALQYFQQVWQIESQLFGESDARTLATRKTCEALSRRVSRGR